MSENSSKEAPDIISIEGDISDVVRLADLAWHVCDMEWSQKVEISKDGQTLIVVLEALIAKANELKKHYHAERGIR